MQLHLAHVTKMSMNVCRDVFDEWNAEYVICQLTRLIVIVSEWQTCLHFLI